MTTNPATSQQAQTADAIEFGRHTKQGGWRLGLLVARNVVPAPGRVALATLAPKTNATRFAELAGTTNDRIIRHLAAWERAANAGLVPHAKDLSPGQEGMRLNGNPFTLDVDRMPAWSEYYKIAMRRNPRIAVGTTSAPTPTPTVNERTGRTIDDAVTEAVASAPTDNEAAAAALDAVATFEAAQRSLAEERAIEAAGDRYRRDMGGDLVPVNRSGAPGATSRLHAEHADEVKHTIAAIKSYTRRLFDIARGDEWQQPGRDEAADAIRNLAQQLTMVADVAADPNVGRATDAAIDQLLTS